MHVLRPHLGPHMARYEIRSANHCSECPINSWVQLAQLSKEAQDIVPVAVFVLSSARETYSKKMPRTAEFCFVVPKLDTKYTRSQVF